MAALEIGAKQALNRRSKADRTYHLVVSFPPGEHPPLVQLHYIEDELCKAIGLADHQRISAVHTDTQHLHLHVAISKVHPVTLCCIEPYYDKQKLMQACERLEIELGLRRTNHGRLAKARQSDGAVAEQQRPGPFRQSGRARDMEAHAARQSLLAWVQEQHRRLPLNTASGWSDFHRQLSGYGLHARLRGAGLVIGATVIGTTGETIHIQASRVDRGLSLHALTMQWGPFVAAGPESTPVRAHERYVGQPTQRSRYSTELFGQYQRSRQAALAIRARDYERLKKAHAKYTTELIAWYENERKRLRSDTRLRGKAKLDALKQLTSKKRADMRQQRKLESEQRREVMSATPLPSWPQYLADLATAGDQRALEVIRYRTRRTGAPGAAESLRAESPVGMRHVVFPTSGTRVDKNGNVVYRLQDGGVVEDGPTAVRILHGTKGAVTLALALAQERFTPQRLLIDGSQQFGSKIAYAAGEQGLDVRFADEQLESLRQTASPARVSQRGQTSVDAYITARNRLYEQKLLDVLEHRKWTAADAGVMRYAGRRRFQDGTEAVLLQRNRQMLVMPVSAAQAAKASTWPVGSSVNVDSRGRFLNSSRGRRT